jgi:hypothetical protein
MSRSDTLNRGAKSTALQRILSAYGSAKTNKSRDLTDGVDLVHTQGVSAVKRISEPASPGIGHPV